MEIKTDALYIRPFKATDFDKVFSYMSDEDTTHFLPSGRMSEDEVKDFLRKSIKAFAVVLPQNSELMGHIEFYPCFGDHTYEIGWVFNRNHQQKGYAFKAASAVIKYGFERLDIHRIVSTCQPENPASYRLMEKLGMVKEGFFRQCIPKGDGVWWDELFYSILKSDYENGFKNIV